MNKHPENNKIGYNLRMLRKAKGLTQEQTIARLQLAGCDISRSVYAQYEAEQRNIRVSDLVALTKIFQCDFNAIFANLG